MNGPLSSILAPVLALGTEYYLFAAAGVLSLGAFVGLILAPALGSYGRAREKLLAGFLSLSDRRLRVGVARRVGAPKPAPAE